MGATQPKEALEGGIGFLVAAQDSDGLWRDFETLAGEASDWTTGFVGANLVGAGVRGATIGAAVTALLAHQHRDGGWGYHRGVPSDADSTACVLLFLATAGRELEAMERAGRCLQQHQDPRSGGVATYAAPDAIRRYMGVPGRLDMSGWCSPHLEVTATAGRAYAAVPRDRFSAAAELAWQYVAGRQVTDGGWRSYWWVERHYPTLQAVALGCTRGDTDSVSRAVAWTLAQQRPNGCWSTTGGEQSAFATALSLAVLLLVGGHDDAARRGLSPLVEMQQHDGSWPAHASMRIPPPHVAEPDGYESWRTDGLGTGVVVSDRHRLFTTAASVWALALATRLAA